jgi:NAD(P)-dependent dehydrogenase (short-subunit alcohol dehydrogenase family)
MAVELPWRPAPGSRNDPPARPGPARSPVIGRRITPTAPEEYSWISDCPARATTVWPPPWPAGHGDPQDVAKGQAAQAATGRFTRPEEVADVVVLLAGNRPAPSPAPTS